MSCDDTTNRAWWIALLVLLLIGAIVWGLYLYGEGNAYPIHAPDAEAESRRVVDGEMLSGMRDQSSRRAADLEAQPGAEGSPSGLARGPVTIHALGPTGASLANVMVTLFEDDDGKATARDAQTDGHGRAIFSDVRLDGSARAVLLYASEAGSGSTECASAKITSGSVDLRSRRGLPLAFRFVVAGQPGSRDVHILKRPYFCGLAGALPSEATAVAVEPGPLEEVLAEWKSPPRCAGRTSSRMRFPFPPDVQQAHGMRPLRQEAEVVLVAKSGARLPRARPTLAIVSLGRLRYTRKQFEVDGFGRIRVPGIPMRFGLPAQVITYFADGSVGSGSTHSGNGPSLSLMFELEISKLEEPAIKDEEIEDHEEFGPSESPEPDASTGKLSLQLTRIDGTPGKGAWAVLRPLGGGRPNWRKANEQGVVTWERWRSGRFGLSVWGIGSTHQQGIEVVAGKETIETIRGTAGGRLRVWVRDHKGRALPYAWVRVSDSELFRHADVRGTSMRIDPYTDRMGKRNFHRLRLGRVHVRAGYGGYEVQGEAEVHASRTTELDLVLDLSK